MTFPLGNPPKKLSEFFFLQKNCWKKHCLKWPKMAENAILTQLIIFFWKKCGKWPGPDPLITQVWTPKKSGKRPSLSVEFTTQNKCKRINVSFVLHCAVGLSTLCFTMQCHCFTVHWVQGVQMKKDTSFVGHLVSPSVLRNCNDGDCST